MANPSHLPWRIAGPSQFRLGPVASDLQVSAPFCASSVGSLPMSVEESPSFCYCMRESPSIGSGAYVVSGDEQMNLSLICSMPSFAVLLGESLLLQSVGGSS